MKHILTLSLCFLALSLSAQVNGWKIPWNPDANGDDLIGVSDLQSLLAVYGQIYSADQIYVTDDETHMLLDVGNMGYVKCLGTCKNLGNHWSMADMVDVGRHDSNLPVPGACWLETETHWIGEVPYQLEYNYQNNSFPALTDGANGGDIGVTCFCATSERPKVEYSYCREDDGDFAECITSKMQEGWYPLGGLSAGGNYSYTHQAFWRWAE